jgi:hypothetical protein
MSEATYGENFDRDVAAAKKAHPEWTDQQIQTTADKTAREASQLSFETGVVAAMLPVPKVGPLVQRMVQLMGFRGAYMVIAGASQDIQSNLALKKNIDPQQAIYDGILANIPANFAQGPAFGLGETAGEIGRGRGPRDVVRATPGGEEIAPTNKAPAEEGPLPVGGQVPNIAPLPVQPGTQ